MEVKVTAERSLPFQSLMNTQTAVATRKPVSPPCPFFFFFTAYHFSPGLMSVLPPVTRQRWLAEGWEWGVMEMVEEALAIVAVEEQMLAGWLLAEAEG